MLRIKKLWPKLFSKLSDPMHTWVPNPHYFCKIIVQEFFIDKYQFHRKFNRSREEINKNIDDHYSAHLAELHCYHKYDYFCDAIKAKFAFLEFTISQCLLRPCFLWWCAGQHSRVPNFLAFSFLEGSAAIFFANPCLPTFDHASLLIFP